MKYPRNRQHKNKLLKSLLTEIANVCLLPSSVTRRFYPSLHEACHSRRGIANDHGIGENLCTKLLIFFLKMQTHWNQKHEVTFSFLLFSSNCPFRLQNAARLPVTARIWALRPGKLRMVILG